MGKAKILPSGNWRARAYLGKDETGKKIYKSFTAPTRKEAELLAAECAVHGRKDDNNITIGEAVQKYIASKKNVLSPSTLQGYERIEKNHLNAIKNMLVADITSRDMQIYVNNLAAKLSPKSVRNVWGLVSSSISAQLPDKKISVTLPAKRHIVRELPDAKSVVDAIKGSDVELPALLAMWLSLRMSEVRGLKYGDIVNGVLTVRRTVLQLDEGDVVREQTKTYNSTRRIKLPSYLLELIGSGDKDEFIIKAPKNTIYDRFVTCIKKAGLPHMRFHDLRHMNASIMLQLNIPERYAMERGGWSTNSTLQNVYQHTFSAEREAVDKKIDLYFENTLGCHAG